ncbi:surface antigen-domain-containing protein [Globomyces pollinis-pini]|nr:surface antigen-domain-containing protein [Globomyces pollinis-pini]
MVAIQDPSVFIINEQHRKMLVNAIKVEGIVHTNNEFLELVTTPLLEARTLGDVIIGSRSIGDKLQRLGIFKSVEITLDANPYSKDSVDVIYKVVEAPRLYGNTGADFGSYEGRMNMSLNVRNAFGNGETISGSSSYGIDTATPLLKRDRVENNLNSMQGASAYHATFTKPLNGDPDTMLEATAYKVDRDHSIFRSYKETLRGLTVKYKNILSNTSIYEAAYDAVWRENHSLTSEASLSVRKEAGHSLKSSVSQSFTLDTRDDIVFPTGGKYIRLSQEFAGLGGNVQFFKNEFHTIGALRLPRNFGLSASLRGGVLFPYSFDAVPRTRINDRFSLGGPTSLRGFEQGGVGPKEKNDSLGGDMYYGLGLGFSFPLPVLPVNFFRGHIFGNGGTLVPLKQGTFFESSKQLLFNPSVSSGIGLVARFTNFRLELNYCVPLRITSTDTLKPGLQFGIGMNFM